MLRDFRLERIHRLGQFLGSVLNAPIQFVNMDERGAFAALSMGRETD